MAKDLSLGALTALEEQIVPKSQFDPNVTALSTGDEKTSTSVLEGMKQRAAELSSPWHQFQTGLDSMVARTHYSPEAATASVEERKAKDAAEVQNIGTTMAQVQLMRNQLGNMKSSFAKMSGAGPQTTAMGDKTTADLTKDEKLLLGVSGNPLQLTPHEIENLRQYVDANDLAGFRSAYRAISNYRGQAEAQNKAKIAYGPEGLEQVKVVKMLTMPDKKTGDAAVTLSKRELYEWEEMGKFPQRLYDIGYRPASTTTQKAAGGIIQQNHLAGGGQPMQPEVEVGPLYTDAGIPISPTGSTNEQPIQQTQTGQPSLARRALGAVGDFLIPSAEAKDWKNALDIDAREAELKKEHKLEEIGATAQQERTTQEEQAKNQSEREMRLNAGKFVSKLQDNTSTYDDVNRKASFIINNAINYPKEFAYKSQEGPYAYLLNAAETILPYGEKVEKGLEHLKAQKEGQDTLNRRDTISGFAKDLGINYTADKFANLARSVGPQLVAVGQEAKNIGIDNTAYTNLTNAYIIRNNAQLHADLAKDWAKYRRSNPKADPYNWMTSENYETIKDKYKKELDNELNALEETISSGNLTKDKNGNPAVWIDGKLMRVKK
jgi:hypothetical protein